MSTSPTVSSPARRTRRPRRSPSPLAPGTRRPRPQACPPPVTAPARTIDRERLADLMQAMAEHQRWACIVLYQEFGGHIARTVTEELRRLHIHRAEPDDLDGLVLDVCFALADCAGGWQPDGALPWNWARARVRAVVGRWVGQFADSYDADVHGIHVPPPVQPYSGDEPSMLDVLEATASHHPVAALLRDALAQAGSPRDQELLLAYEAQKQAGDHSPAITLGVSFGLSPDAVRQAVSRIRRGLRRLVATDQRYAMLEGLSLLQ